MLIRPDGMCVGTVGVGCMELDIQKKAFPPICYVSALHCEFLPDDYNLLLYQHL